MANLIDQELHALALALGAALAANPSPYSAPARIEMTAALIRGDFRSALDLSGSPTEAHEGSDPAERHWYDLACSLAERLEDASRGPIAAPADAEYSIEEPDADEIAWREEQTAADLARRDLDIYRSEFGAADPDEPWFTAAFKYERDPGCDFAQYWAMVQRINEHDEFMRP